MYTKPNAIAMPYKMNGTASNHFPPTQYAHYAKMPFTPCATHTSDRANSRLGPA
jgi:hypothetical protein